jgi:branched-chain amino acid aminotransferase
LDPALLNSIGLRWNHTTGQYDALPYEALAWPVHDLGATHGAFVVERIRTFGGKSHADSAHWERLARGLEMLGLQSPSRIDAIRAAVGQLCHLNEDWIRHQRDTSIVVVVSPGSHMMDPTFESILHLQPLPWKRLKSWYEVGTPLISSPWETGAGHCWPAFTKSRSRLNYYLADRNAMASSDLSLGLLRTHRGSVGDTSVANLILVTIDGDLVSPLPNDVLIGTSFLQLNQFLQESGQCIELRDIQLEELQSAREVWLTGNSGCLWHASSIDGQPIGDGSVGSLCRQWQKKWIESIGFDWLSQGLFNGQ